MAVYNIVAGTTAALRFQLLSSGAPIDLSGCTVVLLLNDRNGTTVASPGTITITDAFNGTISLAPTSTTVFVSTLGPYSARWKVTDGSGKIYYVPTGPRDTWNIVGA